MTNIGLTGAIDVEVNFTESLTEWTFNTTIPFLGPQAWQIVQASWAANSSGVHTLTVKQRTFTGFNEAREPVLDLSN